MKNCFGRNGLEYAGEEMGGKILNVTLFDQSRDAETSPP